MRSAPARPSPATSSVSNAGASSDDRAPEVLADLPTPSPCLRPLQTVIALDDRLDVVERFLRAAHDERSPEAHELPSFGGAVGHPPASPVRESQWITLGFYCLQLRLQLLGRRLVEQQDRDSEGRWRLDASKRVGFPRQGEQNASIEQLGEIRDHLVLQALT